MGGSAMRYAKLLVLVGAAVLGLLALLPEQPAEAQVACCRILSTGAPVAPTPGNTGVCSQSVLLTKRVAVGTYQVDFTALAPNIIQHLKFVSIDRFGGGTSTGQITALDRPGVPSAVEVRTTNSAGIFQDNGFSVCVIGY
jgi:hypothetical protein